MQTTDPAEIQVQIAAFVASIIGLFLIWFQLRQAANTSKLSLLISINRDLNSYHDVAIEVERGADEPGWLDKLDRTELERLLDYISYFEGLYLAYRRGLFTLSEINVYFAGRFFRLAHNADVQKNILTNRPQYDDTFRPIFALHKKLTEYRKRKRLPPLFPKHPLDACDPECYELMSA